MKSGARTQLFSILALLCVSSMTLSMDSTSNAGAVPGDELQSWISENAVAVRSVDAADEDFKDLEFLVDIIGNAQMVQLGEASHSVGNGFAAKARLVRFLHQRMGFDVLVWEEGIYNLRWIQAAMRGSEPVLSVAQRGLRDGWSNSEEVKPLYDYVRVSLLTTHPLEMAGYDPRFSAPAFNHFSSSLRSFAAALSDVTMRKHAKDLVEDALAAYNRICCAKDVRPGQQENLDNVHRAADALLDELRANRERFEQVHGARETEFMERAVESMRSDATGQFYLAQATPGVADAGVYLSKFWHQRDEQGARNLRWLIEKEYPGRKIIFWAHNVHVMDAYCGPMFKGIHRESQPGDMKPVGVYMADWLGDKIYTIGMAHYIGGEGLTGTLNAKPLAPAPPGSLEARLHVLGKPYLFLNLRAMRANSGHALHRPQTMRIITPASEMVSDITEVFDGIFYIDRATPATPAAAPDQSVH